MRVIKINDGTDLRDLYARLKAIGTQITFAEQVAMPGRGAKPDGRYWVLRHDVDRKLPETGILQARADAEFGVRATTFLLHTAPYFDYSPALRDMVREIAALGHDVELHIDAIGEWAEAMAAGQQPPDLWECMWRPLRFLREECGLPVRGCASHGNRLCGKMGFNNYHVFSDWALPEHNKLGHDRYALADFGIDYEAYHLPRIGAVADSGGQWRGGMRCECPDPRGWHRENYPTVEDRLALRDAVIEAFSRCEAGVLHVLIHPNWWSYVE